MTLQSKFNALYSPEYLAHVAYAAQRNELDVAELMFAVFQNGADSAFDIEIDRAMVPTFEVMEINTLTNMLAWVDSRIEAEVTHRPDVNVHKQRLQTTWGQVRDYIVAQMKIATQ